MCGMAAAPRPAGVRRRAGTGQNAQPQRSASWPTDQRSTCRLVRYPPIHKAGRLWTVNWHALLNKPDILFRNERHINILDTAEPAADLAVSHPQSLGAGRSLTPVLFRLPADRRCIRVLHLEAVGRLNGETFDPETARLPSRWSAPWCPARQPSSASARWRQRRRSSLGSSSLRQRSERWPATVYRSGWASAITGRS